MKNWGYINLENLTNFFENWKHAFKWIWTYFLQKQKTNTFSHDMHPHATGSLRPVLLSYDQPSQSQ